MPLSQGLAAGPASHVCPEDGPAGPSFPSVRYNGNPAPLAPSLCGSPLRDQDAPKLGHGLPLTLISSPPVLEVGESKGAFCRQGEEKLVPWGQESQEPLLGGGAGGWLPSENGD